MNWFLLVSYALAASGLTAVMVLLHQRLSFVESRLQMLAEACLNITKGLKIVNETQKSIIEVMKKQVEITRES